MEPRKIFIWLSIIVWPFFVVTGIYAPHLAPLAVVV